MVKLQTLETTNKNLSLVIETSSKVICTRGFTEDNYFNLRISVSQDPNFIEKVVKFKVLVKCQRPPQAEKVSVEKLSGIEKLNGLPIIYPGKITTIAFPQSLITIPDTYLLVEMDKIEAFASYSRGTVTINPRGD